MSRRKLTKEEIGLWQKVVRNTERLEREQGDRSRNLPKPKPAKPVEVRPADRQLKAPTGVKPTSPVRSATAVQMDKKTFGRMKRGKLVPEARIDLHGMTLDRAHPALIRFILSSQASGVRLALVITGKGKLKPDSGPIPARGGVLRHQVPQWLTMAPLSHVVLQVTQAHQSHGGGGAFYVYLRRFR